MIPFKFICFVFVFHFNILKFCLADFAIKGISDKCKQKFEVCGDKTRDCIDLLSNGFAPSVEEKALAEFITCMKTAKYPPRLLKPLKFRIDEESYPILSCFSNAARDCEKCALGTPGLKPFVDKCELCIQDAIFGGPVPPDVSDIPKLGFKSEL